MARKTLSNPQPWLDYFQMLRTYAEHGYLEIQPAKHEAYITRAALATLVNADEERNAAERPVSVGTADGKALLDLVRRLRAYAAYLATAGADYLRHPFALHVVKETEPHDLLLTLLLTRRRRWFAPWRTSDHIEVITYTEEEKS